ncbi:MAG: hypothetical protein ACXV7D_04485 [Thermoanaerobaculia bacterium]
MLRSRNKSPINLPGDALRRLKRRSNHALAKSKKDASGVRVKVQDLKPKNDSKGGVTSIAQASHDTKKAIIANFRV